MLTRNNEEHSVSAIGDALIDTYHLKTPEDVKIRYYAKVEGIYKSDAERIIEKTVRSQINRNISKHDMGEIIYYIQNLTFVPRAEFDNYPGWVHVGNGWLNYFTREYKEHSQEMLSLTKIPWEYKPEATNPEQQKFFADVVEPEDLEPIQKFFGYLLLPDNRYKKAFVLVGPKDTGKSTFLTLVERFTGQVSHVSLHDMAAYNHTVASITQSIVNTTNELPKYKLKDVSLFKSITGNDERTFREIYGRPFPATVRSKFVMASNDLPDFEGMDQTFIDRWILFEFSNVFKKGEDMDVNILDRITTPEEMSGLLNYALDSLAKLLQDGYFKDESYEEHKAKWSTITSKLADFKEHLVFKEGAMIPRAWLYSHYKSKVKEPLSLAIFGREIKKLGILSKQVRLSGKLTRVYEGVTVEEYERVTGVTGNFYTMDYVAGTEEERDTELHVTPVTEEKEESDA